MDLARRDRPAAAGSECRVILPSGAEHAVTSGTHVFAEPA